ncbi:MAG: acyltransferase [Chloroflexota bacterium]|jgi:peptidoglycan/LPS O-acetylase OafA/YrhL|nr:acyltransferase family protein [Caldilinea sp.]GIK75311.1 MAG: acyltransferase [Chloroflexota bacterium]
MKRLESLQSLRLFAAIGVIQYHIWRNYMGIAIGHPGTDFFLVLVGVVAAFSQTRHIAQGRWKQYLVSRAARLYVSFIPLFLATLIIKHDEVTFDWVWRSFFFFPQLEREPVIASTWMLSYFVLFYLIFAASVFFRSERVLWGILLVWAIGIIGYVWFDWSPGLSSEWTTVLFEERNLDFICGFVVGVILRAGFVRIHLARVLTWIGLFGILGGTFVLNFGNTMQGRSLWLGLPVSLFILGVSALEQNMDSGFLITCLKRPRIVFLGTASYVIFLSHSAFIRIWSLFLPVTPIWAPFITVGAVMFGAIGYWLWEAPILAYMKEHFLFMHY